MEYPKTRKEAKESDAKYYYTGLPCSRGHLALRKPKGGCIECLKEDWAADNERRKALPKSEAAKAAGKRYYERNKDMVKARAAARPSIEKAKARKKHKEANPELYKALTSVRKRRHRNATPSWVTAEEKKAIRQMYLQAQYLTKLTGVRYVVDHDYPLFGDTICGLHVLSNLKVMTQEENLKKSNKLLANAKE